MATVVMVAIDRSAMVVMVPVLIVTAMAAIMVVTGVTVMVATQVMVAIRPLQLNTTVMEVITVAMLVIM